MARLVQRDDMNDIPSDSGIEPGAASGDTASSVDAARDGVKSRRIADDITNVVAPQLIDQLSDVLPKLTEEQDKQKKNDSIGSKLMKAKMVAAIISHIPAILGCLCAVAGLGSMVSCAMGFGGGEEETVTTGVSTMMIGDDTAYSYPGSSIEDGNGDDSSSVPLGDWVYYNQNDTSTWGGSTVSGQDWGSSCGIVTFSMVAVSYSGDTQYNPNFGATHWGDRRGSLYGGQAMSYINEHKDVFGLNVSNEAIDWDRIKAVCDKGGCVVMYINPLYVPLTWANSHTTSGRHWIAIRQVTDSEVVIADSAIGKEGRYSYSAFTNSDVPIHDTCYYCEVI